MNLFVASSSPCIATVSGQTVTDQFTVLPNPSGATKLLGYYRSPNVSLAKNALWRTTSNDGIVWTAGTEVLTPSQTWDTNGINSASVVYSGGVYYAYYTGTSSANLQQICLSTSQDGITWSTSQVVLGVGLAGDFDAQSVQAPTVVITPADKEPFKMWYVGRVSGGGAFKLGYATSQNGITWTKHNRTGVFSPSKSWSSGRLGFPRVYSYDVLVRQYDMFFSASTGSTDWSIGHATSLDGINWVEDASPVLTPAQVSWSGLGTSFSVFSPSVYVDSINLIPKPVFGDGFRFRPAVTWHQGLRMWFGRQQDSSSGATAIGTAYMQF